MKNRTHNFTELTAEEANFIQGNKITSLFNIKAAELNQFVTVESLNNWFVEIPPVNLNTREEIMRAINMIDGKTLVGRLQSMYLRAYLNDGRVMFRKIDEDNFQILYIFSYHPLNEVLNKDKQKLTIDGANGFRAVWLIQLYSPSEMLTLTPSISLKVTIDGNVVVNRSVSTMISPMQPQANVGIIHKLYSGFEEMQIEILYNNDEIDNEIHLIYH